MNDFSELFEDKDHPVYVAASSERKEEMNKNVKGHFDREMFERHNNDFGIPKWVEL